MSKFAKINSFFNPENVDSQKLIPAKFYTDHSCHHCINDHKIKSKDSWVKYDPILEKRNIGL